MEGYRFFGPQAAAGRTATPGRARHAPRDYSQAMVVALGFYLFGHLADLATTLSFLRLGRPECNLLPALLLSHGGIPALIATKVLGALVTSWVFWRLRRRPFTVVFACLMALVLIYVASINSLDVLQALAQAAH
jgi:hypothetical protein